jgi:hypothetical protein
MLWLEEMGHDKIRRKLEDRQFGHWFLKRRYFIQYISLPCSSPALTKFHRQLATGFAKAELAKLIGATTEWGKCTSTSLRNFTPHADKIGTSFKISRR